MKLFIKGLGCISPQKTFDPKIFPDGFSSKHASYLEHDPPDYSAFIDSRAARRMAKIIKMGVGAAKKCLEVAGSGKPSAVITATGMGCIQDTENFLTSNIEYEPGLVSPTAFIQSTHNTVGAQISLVLDCNGYNVTYVQRGFSFESALLDSKLWLQENPGQEILVGAADEISPLYYSISRDLGVFKKEEFDSFDLLNNSSEGFLAGEGAAFFLLSTERGENDFAVLQSSEMIFKPEGTPEIQNRLDSMLKEVEMNLNEIDLVLYGYNGDISGDQLYRDAFRDCFATVPAGYFKHLSGEYHTASSFAVWLASMILKTQAIPEAVLVPGTQVPEKIRSVLIYNHFQNNYHTLTLLSR